MSKYQSAIDKGKNKGRMRLILRTIVKERQLWMICIPLLIWVGVFCYYPMYGVLIAFFNYFPGRNIFDCEFVGFKHFHDFFTSPEALPVIRNTLVISGLRILFGFPAPIILAILLNELKNRKFKRVAQTISYLPYFVSWVVVASFVFMLFSYEGLVNEVLIRLKIVDNPLPFLTNGRNFWFIFTAVNIWKGVGWSSIIYLSAMTAIDDELYQAGKVDGLNRFGLIWHITLPGIATTVVLMLILEIGGILNAGFEQQLLIGTEVTRPYHEVLDTYAYKYGIKMGRYSYGAAVGLMKSVIGLTLVLLTNRLSKKLLDIRIV